MPIKQRDPTESTPELGGELDKELAERKMLPTAHNIATHWDAFSPLWLMENPNFITDNAIECSVAATYSQSRALIHDLSKTLHIYIYAGLSKNPHLTQEDMLYLCKNTDNVVFRAPYIELRRQIRAAQTGYTYEYQWLHARWMDPKDPACYIYGNLLGRLTYESLEKFLRRVSGITAHAWVVQSLGTPHRAIESASFEQVMSLLLETCFTQNPKRNPARDNTAQKQQEIRELQETVAQVFLRWLAAYTPRDPALEQQIYQTLIDTQNHEVLLHLTRFQKLPVFVLEQLRHHPNEFVRAGCVKHPNFPIPLWQSMWKEVAEKPQPLILYALLESPSADANALHTFVDHPDYIIRKIIARHPRVRKETLAILLRDRNNEVSFFANIAYGKRTIPINTGSVIFRPTADHPEGVPVYAEQATITTWPQEN